MSERNLELIDDPNYRVARILQLITNLDEYFADHRW